MRIIKLLFGAIIALLFIACNFTNRNSGVVNLSDNKEVDSLVYKLELYIKGDSITKNKDIDYRIEINGTDGSVLEEYFQSQDSLTNVEFVLRCDVAYSIFVSSRYHVNKNLKLLKKEGKECENIQKEIELYMR